MTKSGTGSPSKREVVVLALGDLGGGSEVIDTEDVAVRSYELAQKAFSWRKHPEQIDLDSVRVSLTDACKAKYGSLVGGSVREGWHLTPAGVKWIATAGDDIRSRLGFSSPSKRAGARVETVHMASEISRVKSSDAFRAWSSMQTVTPRTAALAFRIDGYTSERERILKLNRVTQIADATRDDELVRFIDNMTPLIARFSTQRAVPPKQEGEEDDAGFD